MATRRIIRGVLGNFLGTYVSRNSDYKGYLLFGFLVGEFTELTVNLLGQSVSDPHSPVGVAVLSAIARFEDQRGKAGLPVSRIREASLIIRQTPDLSSCSIDGNFRNRLCFSFRAVAVMDNDKLYERTRFEFIASQQEIIARRRSVGIVKGTPSDDACR